MYLILTLNKIYTPKNKGIFFSKRRTYTTDPPKTNIGGANLDGSNGDQNDDDDRNRYGGGKNAQHANKNARNSAKEKYEEAKKNLEDLRKQHPRTKELREEMQKIDKQIKHWKRKMDFSGESHSQKPKGGNS